MTEFAPSPPTVYVDRPVDGLAVASFVLALCGMNVLAVIFGHIALSRVRRDSSSGAGFAIAGLVIGYLTLIAIVIAVLFVVGVTAWAVNVS